MSKYLKKFETEAQYTAAKSGLILPNVSLITENNKVEYNPLNPTPSHIEGELYYRTMDIEGIDRTVLVDWNGNILWVATDGYPNAACVLSVNTIDNNIVIDSINWVDQRDSRFTDSPVGTVYDDDMEYLDGATYENHTFDYVYDEEEVTSYLTCTPNIIGEW